MNRWHLYCGISFDEFKFAEKVNQLIILTMRKNIIASVVIIGLIAWSCSKVETGSDGLKQSIEKGVANISYAVSKISGTTGYQLLSMNDASAKSDMIFNDSINMNMVSGIYDFQPDTIRQFHHFTPYNLFKRTGDSENMVVNLPEMMVFHPKYLHFFEPVDKVYPNNFTITATDYHLYYNWWHNYEYKLTAGLTLDNENAGTMDVYSTYNSFHNPSCVSQFNFSNGYNISEMWQGGDTATSSFFLAKDNDTLFMERNLFIWHDFHKREKQYDLTIGDVQIKKSTGVDSLQVFVGGVLQQHAARILTDDSDTTGSVCHKRDILLTFDDGTTAKLSDFIDPVREQLKTLRESLHNMYFAKHIVDYIAFSIYYESHDYLQ
jgi:hypothetical protein